MSDDCRQSAVNSNQKPVSKSEVLTERVEAILSEWRQKRVNDEKIMKQFEGMAKECFERLNRSFRDLYLKTYADDSTVEQKLKKIDEVLEHIHKIENMFAVLEQKFASVRAQIYPKINWGQNKRSNGS